VIRIMLSKLLGERKLTQADLSRMTGIRANTINLLYHELTDRISVEQIDRICEALDCSVSDLLVQDGKNDTPIRSRRGTTYHNP